MAGRKVFTSGEILTAADVNSFLMDQSVMVFADSSARSSAIPSPSEGMITYLEDTDAVEKFDGSAFVNVSPGGLVAVKSALKTDAESFGSVSAGDDRAVSDLSITHEVSDPANRLIISAFFGNIASSTDLQPVAMAINDGSGFIAFGDDAGDRIRVTAGAQISNAGTGQMASHLSATFVHTPGSGSKTYTMHAVNISSSTRTLHVNRSTSDSNSVLFTRAASALVIQEVAV